MESAFLFVEGLFGANVAYALVDVLEHLVVTADWRVFIYAYALAMFMLERGFGKLAAFWLFCIGCFFVFLAGWHGLAPLVATSIAHELRLSDARRAQRYRLLEIKLLQEKRANAAGPSAHATTK